NQVKADTAPGGRGPFRNFLKAAEDIRHHYRELAKGEYDSPLLRHWIIVSLLASARVHAHLVLNPPASANDHVDDVDQAMRWLVSWIPRYFAKHFNSHHARDAADSMACLAIRLLEHGRLESTEAFGKTISDLALEIVALQAGPYAVSDIE